MKNSVLNTTVKTLLLILAATSAGSSLISPCMAQAPQVSFSQLMIPVAYDKCIPHLTAAFGEKGYAVEQSGDRWSMAIKGSNRAVMICGISEGKSETQLTIFVTGPGNVDDDKNGIQAEMERRFRR